MAYDAKFRSEFVPGRYRDLVARKAVLYPITAFDQRKRPTDARVISATLKLVDMWRARTLALRDHGWIAAQSTGSSKKAVDFMRNCRPNFVSMFPRTRPCSNRHVCPFCFSRGAATVWDAVDSAFPDTTLPENARRVRGVREEQSPPPALGVGERRGRTLTLAQGKTRMAADGVKRTVIPVAERVFPYHLVTMVSRSTFPTRESLPYLVDSVCRTRGQIRDMIPFEGAVVCTTVEGIKSPEWVLTHRYLMMVRPEVDVPDSFLNQAFYERDPHPTRRKVMNAVARTCRYPRHLLFGDPGLTVRVLHAIRGRKLRAMYGSFRGRGR